MEGERVRGKRILIADDERGVRDAIRLLLALDDHTVREANTGAEALELFTRERFDLVITDFEMPRMRGNELAVRIKQISPAQPIIMMTAYAEKLGRSDNPVDLILQKPFEFSELRGAMARLLRT